MIDEHAPLIRWGMFFGMGLMASLGGPAWQLAFAGSAVVVLGLPHGASDLAVIQPSGRFGFLVAYIVCITGVVFFWRSHPSIALAVLLALSAVHFAVDGMLGCDTVKRWSIGFFIVGGPALFHEADIVHLFAEATGHPAGAAILARSLQLTGFLATVSLAYRFITEEKALQDLQVLDVAALVGALLLPPLVGFAIGFIILHARSQTNERQTAIGCATLASYLIRVAPLMVGAVVVLVLIAVVTFTGSGGGSAFLFAGIAALATPHMLVTPFWIRRDARQMRAR